MKRLDDIRPVWAEINLDNIRHNFEEVKRVTKDDTLLCAVIKADGYGHGAVEIAQTLIDAGANWLAVATTSEALQLRRNYKDIPILVLGYTNDEAMEVSIKNDITITIYSIEQGQYLSRLCNQLGIKANVHIKIDSGMSRLGLQCDEQGKEEIKQICSLSDINIQGIFTHFARADETSKAMTEDQVEKYKSVLEYLEENSINIPIKHVSNSAAIIDMPELNYNMVRAGIMLYGLYPSKEVSHKNVILKEAMSLKAKISHVKKLEAGRGISYGHKFTTEKETNIATIPLGYADGFTRMLSMKTECLVNGHRVPLIGRICMDQSMIDVTGFETKRGDVVTLFGTDMHGNSISIDEIADSIDTINYEIVCMISKRVPRAYIKNGSIVAIKDIIDLI